MCESAIPKPGEEKPSSFESNKEKRWLEAAELEELKLTKNELKTPQLLL